MQQILGYQSEDLMNKCLYDYHHSGDSDSLMASFKNGKFLVIGNRLLFELACQLYFLSRTIEIPMPSDGPRRIVQWTETNIWDIAIENYGDQ